MRVRTLFSLLFTILTLSISAQEQLGLRLGSYSGVQSLQMNPSWQVNGPLKWDVNIVAGGVFVHQDYLYGRKGSMLKLLSNGGEVVTDDNAIAGSDGNSSVNGVPFYFEENNNYDFHHNAFVMAPSFMVNMRQHSFGMYLNTRTWSSGYDLDGDLGYFNLIDSAIFLGNIDPFQVGIMNWGEIGATYATNIKTSRKIEINAGATLKFLLGIDAVGVRSKQDVDVIRMDDQIALGPTELEMSYASNYNDESYDFKRNGFGAAADLGVTFVRPENRNGNKLYKWKVGVSLLDVGRVKYRKNANTYSYSTTDSSYFNTAQFEDVRDPDDLIEAINNSGNSTIATLTDDKFGMWTPMALSVQFDAPLVKKLYLSGTAVVGMRFKGNAAERSDLLAVTPRIEGRWLEFGMPISLYRWKEVQLGTYVRLGPLTVGTERLNSWFIPGQLEGSDIYFALKIHSGMFKKSCKARESEKGSGCFANHL